MTAIVVVVLSMLYLGWVGRRASRRGALGLCIRCGRSGAVVDGASVEGMCAACAETTRRNHRTGFFFFISLPVIGLTAVTLGLISDWRAGFGFSWIYIPMILMIAILPLAIAAFIRSSGNR
jgi:uncharacterized protein (DUF983 family)